MIRKNIFGGCSPRLNTSCCNDVYIYFCSNSNILISDSIAIKDVLFLDNQLNFLNEKNEIIIAGDTKGRIYIMENGLISKRDVFVNVQNGIILSNSKLVYMTLDSVVLYDYIKKVELYSYKIKDIISSCCYTNNYVFIGTSEGNVLIFNHQLEQISILNCHLDRIQSMALTLIDENTIIATSSKDNTVKIWKEKNNTLEHIQTLNGHSYWVLSVYWCRNNDLISSSFDKSIIVWTKSERFSWTNTNIYGGTKAFYNAFEYCGVVYGQSASGGFYKFENELTDFISGHIDEVTSLDWNDSFLLTSSLDKTSRIFLDNREIIRPQNHGYPITVSKFLGNEDLSIISGSQETIIRVLEPIYIVYMIINSNKNFLSFIEKENLMYKKDLPDAKAVENLKIAAVPAELSLTNDIIEDFDFEGLNEYLLTSTTFNEIKKVYGHYFDISDIDVSDKFIISVNKALTKKFSGLFLWNRSYEIVEYLEVHNSTINRVRFSPDGKYLCTVSNDKTSSLIEVSEGMKIKYQNTDHTRVVWDCAFSHDTKYYATCSRDKNVYIYEVATNKIQFVKVMDEEVTTIDFNPLKYELLIGLLSGTVRKIVFKIENFILEKDFNYKTNSRRINILRYNKDGRYVAIAGNDWLVTTFETK